MVLIGGKMSERISNDSEKSPSISRYDSLENFGEFNKEAANAARAEKAESLKDKEKETEEFAHNLEKTNEYMNMMEEAMNHNASQDVINTIADKIIKSLDSAEDSNETVGDKAFRGFVEENPRPF